LDISGALLKPEGRLGSCDLSPLLFKMWIHTPSCLIAWFLTSWLREDAESLMQRACQGWGAAHKALALE